ncbi:hypothetical protein J6590_012686 [Homalodisca vitripennis]|nr:hypothetical protein J6590_012686 [Homalodisca vitripennis]
MFQRYRADRQNEIYPALRVIGFAKAQPIRAGLYNNNRSFRNIWLIELVGIVPMVVIIEKRQKSAGVARSGSRLVHTWEA